MSFLYEITDDKCKNSLYNFSEDYTKDKINSFYIPVSEFLSNSHDNDKLSEEEKSKIYRQISDTICNIIPTIIQKNEKSLHFIVWSNSEHSSLVVECNGNFYFLDSCGYYFQRFPVKNNGTIEPNKNAFYVSSQFNDIANQQSSFHIESQIQADSFTCTSYCFEFAKTILDIFLSFNKTEENFNNYMKSFFINDDGSEFHVDYKPDNSNSERRFGLLPPKILIYFQSFEFLKNKF